MATLATSRLALGSTNQVPPLRRRRRRSLTTARILAWADAHYRRTGAWPKQSSGAVTDAPGETWSALDFALRYSTRGLPGGDSLARLLRREGRIGERRGRPPKVSRQLAGRLRACGLSLAEIGRRMGVSRQAVWEMVKKSSAVVGVF
jgi:hypothetical protein